MGKAREEDVVLEAGLSEAVVVGRAVEPGAEDCTVVRVGLVGLAVLTEPTETVAGFSDAGVEDRAVEPGAEDCPVVRVGVVGLAVLAEPTDLVAGFSEVGAVGEAVAPVLEKRPVVLPAPDAGFSETAVADV
jgi:hypothetical protein